MTLDRGLHRGAGGRRGRTPPGGGRPAAAGTASGRPPSCAGRPPGPRRLRPRPCRDRRQRPRPSARSCWRDSLDSGTANSISQRPYAGRRAEDPARCGPRPARRRDPVRRGRPAAAALHRAVPPGQVRGRPGARRLSGRWGARRAAGRAPVRRGRRPGADDLRNAVFAAATLAFAFAPSAEVLAWPASCRGWVGDLLVGRPCLGDGQRAARTARGRRRRRRGDGRDGHRARPGRRRAREERPRPRSRSSR